MRVPGRTVRGRKSRLALASLAVVAIVLSGCAPSPSSSDRMVEVGAVEPLALRPECSDSACRTIAPALFASLTSLGPSGEVRLDLAESIRTGDDMRAASDGSVPGDDLDPRVEVVVREGARFSDGTPITAAHFVDTWRALALSTEDASLASLFAPFRGYLTDPSTDLVESGALELVDDATFVIRLESRMADFAAHLSLLAFAPQPVGALGSAAAARAPVASGPYRLASADDWRSGESLRLEPNPEYRGVRLARNAGLEFRFFASPSVALAELLTGELDVVAPLSESLWTSAADVLGGRVASAMLPELFVLQPPLERAAFRGEAGALRRLALALALDRPEWVEAVWGESAAVAPGFLPTTAMPSMAVPFDQRRARDVWRAANDLSPISTDLVIVQIDDEVPAESADAVAAILADALEVPVSVARYATRADYLAAIDEGATRGVELRRIVGSSPAWLQFFAQSGVTDAVAAGVLEPTVLDALGIARPGLEQRLALGEAQATVASSMPFVPLAVPLGAVAHDPAIVGLRLGWGAVPEWQSVRIRD